MKSVATILVVLFLLPVAAYAEIVAPKPGVELPQAYFDRVSEDKAAFEFQRAWIEKTRRAKAAREEFLSSSRTRGVDLTSLPEMERQKMVVAGDAFVPVMMGKFANTGGDPYPISMLQEKLFGPSASLTMTDLYSEMSYGNLNVSGTVFPWVTMPQADTYYEGGTNGLAPPAKTGEFILSLLVANDPSVDFGLYDNDGPDGVPNSGDDDGFVDFIAVVHPENGGECGTSNLWSHRWIVGAWAAFGRVGNTPGPPWQTNDSSANGGNIMVWDYTMMPAIGSGGGCSPGVTEIGVYCHEFGHAFGLPDFYDTNGGGQGIGHWGLMGSGNWNSSTNPAHMMAYSKQELGWIMPTEVGHTAQPYTVNSSEMTAQAYRLNIYEEKFSRKDFTPIAGSYSLLCGLTSTEAAARNWGDGSGYGNLWDESIRHDFAYSGSGTVTLEYDFSHDTEGGFDYGHVKIEVDGVETTLVSYDGLGSGHATFNITSIVSGAVDPNYQVIFQFTSDSAWSDEDGQYATGSGGPFKIDNISVNGGGEAYFTDLEQHEDGWYYDFDKNPTREYFLVENRNSTGALFDQMLNGQGLLILHIEENVMNSDLGNSGGSTNQIARGVMVEEADGLTELLFTSDRGDAGDVFPGTTNNTTFNNASSPNSMSHNGLATQVLVQSISGASASMTATMRAGRVAPTISSVTPNGGDNDQIVSIADLSGADFVHGATFLLRDASMSERLATNVRWIGKAKLSGDLDLNGLTTGDYDVVIRNPDGQEAVLANAFAVGGVPVFIQAFDAKVEGMRVQLSWEIWSDEAIQGFKLLRNDVAQGEEGIINDGALLGPSERRFNDEATEPGTTYEYVLLVVLEDGSELPSPRVRAVTAGFALALFQNEPNPFNPSTRISFSLPQSEHVTLTIYDVRGKKVTTLVDDVRTAGRNEVQWTGINANGAPVSTGVYFYRLQAGGSALTRKLILLK